MKKPLKWGLLFSLTCCLMFCAAPALADSVAETLPFRYQVSEFLTGSLVRIILLTLGIAGITVEALTIGSFGMFGLVGIGSFALYFLGSYWAGDLTTATVWLLVIGLFLLVLEIFVVPGFGFTGVAGILFMVVALLLASPNLAAAGWEFLAAIVLAAVMIWFSLKNRRTRALWGKLVLRNKSDSESGYDATDVSLARLLGKSGQSLTPLRPAGAALIDGQRIDVVTDGEFIEADRPVRVMLVEGMRVVVVEEK